MMLSQYLDHSSLLAGAEPVPEPEVMVLRMVNGGIINYNYLITDPLSKHAVIVDPAWDMDKIERAVLVTQVQLVGVLITHSHPDHIDLATEVADKYQCPIWISEQEIACSGFNGPQVIAINDQPWRVGNMWINPILTPGHTPGCVCYLIGENLFTGDVLFAEGCGLCIDRPAAFAMYDSLHHLKQTLAANTKIYPGHCYVRPPGQPFAAVISHNMYLQFNNQQDFAAYRLRRGQTSRKILAFR